MPPAGFLQMKNLLRMAAFLFYFPSHLIPLPLQLFIKKKSPLSSLCLSNTIKPHWDPSRQNGQSIQIQWSQTEQPQQNKSSTSSKSSCWRLHTWCMCTQGLLLQVVHTRKGLVKSLVQLVRSLRMSVVNLDCFLQVCVATSLWGFIKMVKP